MERTNTSNLDFFYKKIFYPLLGIQQIIVGIAIPFLFFKTTSLLFSLMIGLGAAKILLGTYILFNEYQKGTFGKQQPKFNHYAPNNAENLNDKNRTLHQHKIAEQQSLTGKKTDKAITHSQRDLAEGQDALKTETALN